MYKLLVNNIVIKEKFSFVFSLFSVPFAYFFAG